jgi:hypothetical protein
MQPRWNTLPQFLIEQFPELRDEVEEDYLAWLSVQSNPYPHFFLMQFFAPILTGQHRLSSEPERTRAGVILEQMLVSSDQDLAGAALTAIVEVFRDDSQATSAAWPFLGPVAKDWLSKLVQG